MKSGSLNLLSRPVMGLPLYTWHIQYEDVYFGKTRMFSNKADLTEISG
jgi:hypothetical protein